MHPALITRLVLPLVAVAAVAIFVHTQWAADGFFLNLATELIGILITVAYVDWILRHNEEQRWRGTKARISTRLQYCASSTVTGIRVSLGFNTDVFDNALMDDGDVDAMRGEVMRVAVHVLVPAARSRIDALDPAGWKKLCAHLEAKSRECGKLLDRFESRLKPRVIEVLLDLQQSLDSAQTFLRVFPDIAGVPVDQLPYIKTPPEEFQAAWNELTAKDVRKVLEGANTLSAMVRNDA